MPWNKKDKGAGRGYSDAEYLRTLSGADGEFLKGVRGTGIFMVVLAYVGAIWLEAEK